MKKRALSFLMTLLLAVTYQFSTLCLPALANTSDQADHKNVFSDLGTGHWAYKPVSNLAGHGIFSGYPDGTFKPDQAVTRPEFAVMLAAVAGLKPQKLQGVYPDVPAGAWFGPAAEAVQQYFPGITQTNGQVLFRPNDNASRQDVVTALVKAVKADYHQADPRLLQENFRDYDKINDDSRLPIAWALQNNLVRGYPGGDFGPNGGITRAEVATLIFRAYFIDTSINGLINGNQIMPFTDSSPSYRELEANLNDKYGQIISSDYHVRYFVREQQTYAGEGPELMYLFGAIDNLKYLNWVAGLNDDILKQAVEQSKQVALEAAAAYPGKDILVMLGHTRIFYFDVRDVYGEKYLHPVSDGWQLNRFYSGAIAKNGTINQTWMDKL